MSNPLNPLSNYRSYRYYHILALCNNSATAEALAGATDPETWLRRSELHEGRSKLKLGKWAPREIAVPGTDDPGLYSILIHGMADADLSINSYKLTAFTAAKASQSDRSTSVATEGELEISEPKGVVFFDTMINCIREMESDAATTCFVLKTFFVGYKYDTVSMEDSIEYLNDLSPVMFYVTDATATYTVEGGVYNLQFVAFANGVTRLPQYSRAADGIAVHLADVGNTRTTVKTALEKLFAVVKRNYDQHYDCVLAVARNKGIDNPQDQFCRVNYVIEVDDVYADPRYFISDSPIQYKIGGNDCFEPPTFKNATGASIEDAIHKILGMSPQVKKDMVDGAGDGENAIKYEYKIVSALETQRVGKDTVYTVKYVVRRFVAPRGLNIQRLLEGKGLSGGESTALRQNIITFDYIFSGKNIDILEFDLKLNYGLAYLQTASTANVFKDQLEVVSSRSMHVSSHSDQNDKFGTTLPTPVFFSPQLRGLSANNTQNPATTSQSVFSMAKHASLEVAEASVKIIGNPLLYSSMAYTTQPASVLTTNIPNQTAPAATTDTDVPLLEQANFKYWSVFPALAKINIYMPSHNDDVALLTGATAAGDVAIPPDYARKFWYDGYYYVYGVESMFNEGEFTQTLQMVAIPNGAKLEEPGKITSQDEQSAKSITECYDSKAAIRQSAPPKPNYSFDPVAPPEPIRENTAIANAGARVTNRQDAESINTAAGGGPADVKGWRSATAEVKNAILNASRIKGVDAKTLAQFAFIESSFNPNARAGTSSATGLYQHINNTWMDLVRSGRINTIAANTPRETALSQRTDPVSSALGGAAYIQLNAASIGSTKPGDLYLAHFAGPGVAKKIIRACDTGRGGETLETILGDVKTNAMRKANPFMNNLVTAEQLRSWAAKKMANSLLNGVTSSGSEQVNINRTKGSRNTPTASSPPSKEPVTQRSAGQAASAANGNPDTASNPNKKECGTKTPPATDQQGKTVAGQPSKVTSTRNPTDTSPRRGR